MESFCVFIVLLKFVGVQLFNLPIRCNQPHIFFAAFYLLCAIFVELLLRSCAV